MYSNLSGSKFLHIKHNKNRENGSLKPSEEDFSRKEATEMLKELIDKLDKRDLEKGLGSSSMEGNYFGVDNQKEVRDESKQDGSIS